MKIRWGVAGCLLAGAVAIGVSGIASADTSAGLQWLAAQTRTNGSVAATGDIATPYQAGAEVLRATSMVGQAAPVGVVALRQYLSTEPYAGAEYLSRRIVTAAEASASTTALVSTLLSQQNIDGGYGEFLEFHSNALDTAFALEALAAVNQATSAQLSSAVGYLVSIQNADGSWGDAAQAHSVNYTTALALRALWHFRARFNIAASLNKGRDYLLGTRSGDLWGAPYESATALIALAPILADKAQVAASASALQAQQQVDGSWAGDVFSTALALRALSIYGQPSPNPDLASVSATFMDAQTGLPLSGVQVTLSGPSNAVQTTGPDGRAQFINLLAPGSYELAVQKPGYRSIIVTTSLLVGQLANLGSFQLIKGEAGSPPTTATVKGAARDAATGEPLAGVGILINGSVAVTTDASGVFLVSNVAPGSITLGAAKPGYSSVSATATLAAGAILVFSPSLTAVESPDTVLKGTVTDAGAGMPLASVNVTLSGAGSASTITGSDGRYQFSGLSPGQYTVVVSRSGLDTVNAAINLPENSVTDFSPKLYPSTTTPAGANGATVTGLILDSRTNQPLANATVTVGQAFKAHRYWRVRVTAASGVSGQFFGIFSEVELFGDAGSQDLTHDGAPGASSRFSTSFSPSNAFDDDTTTSWSSLAGLPQWISYALPEPAVVVGYSLRYYTTDARFYPTAWTLDYSDDGENWTIADARSGQSFTLNQRKTFSLTSTVQADSNGRFSVEGLHSPQIVLGAVQPGYQPAELVVPLHPTIETDVGEVRLRPVAVDQLLPDLRLNAVDSRTGVSTDLQTLQVGGAVSAELRNSGDALAPAGIQLRAFHDANFDGRYTAGIDVLLGEAVTTSSLDAGGSVGVQIPLAGSVPFRDAPILVWADAGETVPELNELNNTASSADDCRRPPSPLGPVSPVLKWHWSSSTKMPTFNQVLSAPVVAQTNDDNGDGHIDSNDYPDIIFVGYATNSINTPGIVRVISGRDGTELLAITDPAHRTWASTSPAVGDIDNDGLVEIVVGSYPDGGIQVFENDGTFKWANSQSPVADTEFGAPAIADLDGDGQPEIIFGSYVYNNNGSLKWIGAGGYTTGSNYMQFAPTSAVANIDNDGPSELIVGASVYNANGTLRWINPAVGDGMVAVGNFDADPTPEIVVVSSGRVTLLNNDGVKIWGPVSIPGGGRGGAPTIGDFDGDGEPEIGVAGDERYVVFETDGSIKWQSVIQDVSSNVTGSTVFDFNGDGEAEVAYADETNLRIYNGRTGAVVYSIVNSSGTGIEHPVLADIDNDGHAELVVISNRWLGNTAGSTVGVRAFEAANDDWAGTRPIWNQHSYHVTNVNDDGSIPRDEEPSWLAHNSYRQNTYLDPDRSPLDAADLTASLLHVIDNGQGQALSLEVRVGNGGMVANAAGQVLAFYDGDPAAGGLLVGARTVPAIEPGRYADLRVDGVTGLSGAHDVYAVVDSMQTLAECSEVNNTTFTSFAPSAALGAISIAADKPVYDSIDAAVLTAVSANIGSVPEQFSSEIVVEDLGGAVVARFGASAAAIAGGANNSRVEPWLIRNVRAGVYVARATLRNGMGMLVDEDTSSFQVRAGSGAALASLQVSTERQAYHVNDTVRIDNLVRNLVDSHGIAGSTLRLRIDDPLGTQVYSASLPLGDIPALGQAQRQASFMLEQAAVGEYTVFGQVNDAADAPLTSSQALFQVQFAQVASVTGAVAVQNGSILQGQPQSCTDTVSNASAAAYPGLVLRRSLLQLPSSAEIASVETGINLAAMDSEALERTYVTHDLAAGEYACALEMQAGGEWTSLGYARFKVATEASQIANSVAADKAVYAVADEVSLANIVTNSAQYRMERDMVLHLLVIAPSGAITYSSDIALGNVAVGTHAPPPAVFALAGAEEGVYAVNAAITGTGGVALSQAQTSFTVRKTLAQALQGAVSVELASVYQGQPQSCTDTVLNNSINANAGVNLRQSLRRIDPPETLISADSSVDLAANGQRILVRPVATGALAPAGYICELQAQTGAGWTTLGAAEFTVLQEPLSIGEAIVTDKPTYASSDTALLTATVSNAAHYRSLGNASVSFRVLSLSGVSLFEQALPLTALAPQASMPVSLSYAFSTLAEGVYSVESDVLGAGGSALAHAQTSFEVRRTLGEALSGSVEAAFSSVQQGQEQTCTDTVHNGSQHALSGMHIRQLLNRLDPASTVSSANASVDLAANGEQVLSRAVATSALAIGDYACVLEAEIENGWTVLGSAGFAVTLEPVQVQISVSVDKPVYNPSEQVQLTATAKNLAQYRAEYGDVLRLSVISPTGSSAFAQDFALPDYAAGAELARNATLSLSNATEGVYAVHGYLLNSAGDVIAGDDTSFEVRKAVAQAISGSVTVQHPTRTVGESQTCTDTVSNGSLNAISGLQIRQVLERTDAPQLISTTPLTVSVPANGNDVQTRVFSTANLALGSYACRLDARIDGQWQTLGSRPFVIDSLPLLVNQSLARGDKGRLLVLMDGPQSAPDNSGLCNNGLVDVLLEADFDPPLSPDAVVEVQLKNLLGLVVDTETGKPGSFATEINGHVIGNGLDIRISDLGAGHAVVHLVGNVAGGLLGSKYTMVVKTTQGLLQQTSVSTGLIDLACNVPYAIGDVLNDTLTVIGFGPNPADNEYHKGIGDGADVKTPAQQKAMLESLLQQQGWTYTVATSAQAFADAFHGGGYAHYALLSEYEVLSEYTQKELREAVYAGAGLLVAGRHDVRNRILDEPLGIEYSGVHLNPQQVQLPASDVFAPGQASFAEGGRVQRVHLKGADELGRIPGGGAHDTGVGREGYGLGKTVYVGFDLLAEAGIAGLGSTFADILAKPITYVHPAQTGTDAGRAVPVRLTIVNQAIANTSTVTVSASLGGSILQASQGSISGSVLTWTTSLAVGQSKTLDLWVKLPLAATPVTVSASLHAASGSFSYDAPLATLQLNPVVPPGLGSAIADLVPYVQAQPNGGFLINLLGQLLNIKTPAKRALEYLQAADAVLASGNLESARANLLAATDQLKEDPAAAIVPVRLKVDRAILEVQQLLY